MLSCWDRNPLNLHSKTYHCAHPLQTVNLQQMMHVVALSRQPRQKESPSDRRELHELSRSLKGSSHVVQSCHSHMYVVLDFAGKVHVEFCLPRSQTALSRTCLASTEPGLRERRVEPAVLTAIHSAVPLSARQKMNHITIRRLPKAGKPEITMDSTS